MEPTGELSAYNQKILRYEWDSLIILIAEDIDINYMFLAEAFKKTRAQLLWAKNGQEAVDMIATNDAISVLVTDIQMPVKDGFTATREIRAMKPKLPIIAYTAYSYEGVKEKMLLAGAQECLIKPFDSRQLLITIRKYLFKS
jgi:two-component system cell cycle response regulator DivK